MRQCVLAAEVSSWGGARGCCFCVVLPKDGISLPKMEAAGNGGVARENVSWSSGWADGAVIVHSTGEPDPSQSCSPIRDISTCRPHDEHLTVGMKRDSLPTAAISGVLCDVGSCLDVRGWRRKVSGGQTGERARRFQVDLPPGFPITLSCRRGASVVVIGPTLQVGSELCNKGLVIF